MGCSNTRLPHFGQGPRGVKPEKSTFSAPSPSDGLPKSNSALNSGVSRTTAAKGLPILLRNPVKGPTVFFSISVSISSGANSRLDTTFQIEKSHFWHLNLRYVSFTWLPHLGQGVFKVRNAVSGMSP